MLYSCQAAQLAGKCQVTAKPSLASPEYHRPMDQSTSPTRDRLAAIARNAMKDRGLLPDFSPAAIAELDTVAQAGAATLPQPGDSIRDLRELPWASIDNDDSRDLDQLS